MAVREIRQSIVPTAPVTITERFRAESANFWLTTLFKLIATAPTFVRAAKPVFVRLAYVFSPKIRHATRANAIKIFGPTSTCRQHRRFGLNVVRSFYDFVYDVGRSIGKTSDQLAERIETTEGLENYRHAREQGKGAIILTAHLGSFEVGLVALSRAEKNKIHVVFKRDDVGAFEQLRTQLRRQLNVTEAPIDDGWPVWMALRSALLNDEVVAIQGDRVMPGQKGLAVPLLNGRILLPTGPFKLALASGSPVIPIFSIRTPAGKVRIFIEKAIEVSHTPHAVDEAVRLFATVLQKYIAAWPDQWLVLHPAFLDDSPLPPNL